MLISLEVQTVQDKLPFRVLSDIGDVGVADGSRYLVLSGQSLLPALLLCALIGCFIAQLQQVGAEFRLFSVNEASSRPECVTRQCMLAWILGKPPRDDEGTPAAVWSARENPINSTSYPGSRTEYPLRSRFIFFSVMRRRGAPRRIKTTPRRARAWLAVCRYISTAPWWPAAI